MDSTYFYSDVSHEGPFDVSTMQFAGFTIARLIKDNTDSTVKAMGASFEVDTTNLYEIAYDGVFRLKLKNIFFNYTKAKLPRGKKKLDVDLYVAILASYITKDGALHRNDTIGEFETTLTGVCLQNPDSCKRFANTPMKGWSFVVPRSYCHDEHGKDLWNKGSYKVYVYVKETSKPRKVKGWLLSGSGNLLQNEDSSIDVKGMLNDVFNQNK
jgi:hypothetical protein